ncbi:hypothetical protein ACOMHN_057296 [Nucella lapillus]
MRFNNLEGYQLQGECYPDIAGSMRELREGLRHVALLNIVASASHDTSPPGAPPPTDGRPAQPPGAAAASSPLPGATQPKKRSSSPLALQVTGSRGAPFPQTTEGGGRSAGCSPHHRDGSASPSPHALVASLLSPRARTISIPRPGPQVPPDLPGPFIHKSVSLAKDCLAKVGLTVKPRAESREDEEGGGEEGSEERRKTKGVLPPPPHAAAGGTLDVSMLKVNGVGSGPVPGLILTARGQSLEKPPPHHHHHASGHASNSSATDPTHSSGNPHSAQSRNTSVTGSSSSTTQPPGSSFALDSSRSTSGGLTARADARGGEERCGPTLYVRRHLTPGKKRELVMRLSEMAKCEAVDMAHSLAKGQGPELSMPPMIIMSQQRLEQKRQEDSYSSSDHTAVPTDPSSLNGVDLDLLNMAKLSGAVPRAKSLSSLIASNNYHYTSLAARAGRLPVQRELDHLTPELSDLQQAQSVNDLTEEGVQQGDFPPDTPNPTPITDVAAISQSLFTNGIVGKTIRKDREGEERVESRPLLPATPTVRSRHGRRHSDLSSSLRDRAPGDPTANPLTPSSSFNPDTSSTFSSSSSSATTTTTVLSLNPTTPSSSSLRPLHRSNSFTAAETMTSEQGFMTSSALPVLTITGLQREKTLPLAGVPSSMTAAAALAASSATTPSTPHPGSRTSLNQRLQLVQELDDQCEKLQRQLNITLTVPRKPPHWQHSPLPQAPPISRADLSVHLQCVPLGEGRSLDPAKDTISPSSSSPSHPLLPHPLQMGPKGAGRALSDVDEQSAHGGGGGSGGMPTDRTHPPEEDAASQEEDLSMAESDREPCPSGHHPENRQVRSGDFPSACRPDETRAPHGEANHQAAPSPPEQQLAGTEALPDPVLQGVKEPRYQGFSSKVSDHEGRSQFHYVHPPAGLQEQPQVPDEVREMKYRVLKALDQDVYYDFQHRKYRNSPANGAAAAAAPSPATPLARCPKEEDRPRVHFYKVKVNGDT